MRNVTQRRSRTRVRPGSTGASADAVAAYAAFSAFGTFWGAWGAALPTIRSQAGLTDGELGTALLFVGAGALPAMLVTGWLLDRWGLRLVAPLLTLLGGAGVVVALGARDLPSVIVCLLLVGATSGAADVAINTLAGHAEQHTARAVVTRAHGAFSLAVVLASLGVGAALARDVGIVATFSLVAAAVAALSRLVRVDHQSARIPRDAAIRPRRPALADGQARSIALLPLVALGLVGALAYATENAHQSWGAVLIADEFGASPQLTSLAPATFAATAAVTRLALAPWSRRSPLILLVTGGAVATTGSFVVATAPTVTIALLGLSIAAAGTATLFPTLLSYTMRDIAADRRARATSAMTTTAYLGYLLGPACVGLIADTFGLRNAIWAIALTALIFTAISAPVGRWARRAIA